MNLNFENSLTHAYGCRRYCAVRLFHPLNTFTSHRHNLDNQGLSGVFSVGKFRWFKMNIHGAGFKIVDFLFFILMVAAFPPISGFRRYANPLYPV